MKAKQQDKARGNEKEDDEKAAKEPKAKRGRKGKQDGGEEDFQTTAEVAKDLGDVGLVKLRLLIENKKITPPKRIETEDPSDDGYRWYAENKEEVRNALAEASESETGKVGDGLLTTAQVAEVMSQRLNGTAVRADEVLLMIANGKIPSPKLIDEKDRQDVNDDGYRWSHEIVEEAIVAYPPFKESLAAKSSTQHKPTLAEAQAKIDEALDQTYRVTHGPHNPIVQAPHSKTPTAVELPPTET
jgi:hypothetical protein